MCVPEGADVEFSVRFCGSDNRRRVPLCARNQAKIEAPMLGGGEDDASRRGPLEFFTNMFKRRRDHDPHDDPRPPDITLHEPEQLAESWPQDQMVLARSDMDVTSSSEPVIGGSDTMASLESMASSCENLIGGSAIMHHTPVKSRDIGVDMEAIRLSRQDNPYLQRVAGSQTTLNEDDDAGDCMGNNQPEDLAQLVTQSGVQQEPALSLSEVHEHLIRSPPPTSLPKTITKNMFVFPLSKTTDDGAMGSQKPPPNKFIQRYHSVNFHSLPVEQQVSSSVPCRTHSLNPLVSRGHEDVLDQHLRQILNTQRQLVVSKGRAGDSGGMTCSSVPGSPAHGRSVARRSPHARTLSEEAAVVQSVGAHSMGGGSSVVGGADMVIDRGPANMGARPTYLGRGPTNVVGGAINKGGVSSNTATGLADTGGVGGPSTQSSSNAPHSSGLAPLLPPGRRQHTPTDLLLNPGNPPTNLAHPTISNPAHLPVNPAYRPTTNSGTATPPILKPINTKTRKSPGMKSEGGLATTSSSLSLPIRYPHQPASSSTLIDTT
ncbi:uncharacterized protein [Macrobrachium rosenbergii]|uniref:uncharacterized protein isoform X3 n=1 Tax=Macrobrachium rosenbergii TaxID=79674 RepID=UPI0034D5DF87